MNLRVVVRILGLLMIATGVSMLFPMLVALGHGFENQLALQPAAACSGRVDRSDRQPTAVEVEDEVDVGFVADCTVEPRDAPVDVGVERP